MTATSDRLYFLLPSIYRLRDASEGEPLRALLSVIEAEFRALETDIAGLYDDWFIETCAEWVVPYIGDLLGVRGLNAAGGEAGGGTAFSLRAYVANTLAYRRRKGTATMLEQLARDVTGWNARVVEFFELLATTQHLNHLRPHNRRTPDLRNAAALELLDTPFDTAAHTANVRHIADLRPGQRSQLDWPPFANIPNIGIFLWRLQAYHIENSDTRLLAPNQYTFHPLGYDQPLFNTPRTESDAQGRASITHLAEEINVPGELRRRPLFAELEALRQAIADAAASNPLYFDPDRPVIEVFLDGSDTAVPSEQLLICDLSTWQAPPATQDYTRSDGSTATLPIAAAVDPLLGRLTLPAGPAHDPVRVSYAYGFSGDVGGGPYNRSASVAAALRGPITWQVGVSQRATPVPGLIFPTLAQAVQAWNADPQPVGVIAILDSCSYAEALTGANKILIPEGCQLLLVAADWPLVEDAELPGVFTRRLGDLTPSGLRPHLNGNIDVQGTAAPDSANPGELALNGLLVEGRLRVTAGNLGGLRLDHCTLVPNGVSLTVSTSATPGEQNDQLRLRLERSICGRIVLPEAIPALEMVASLVDSAGAAVGLAAPGTDALLNECTLFGRANLRSLEASNTIFTRTLTVERQQAGCVRYSFVPYGSTTPRRYRCQPDLALAQRAEELGLPSAASLPPAQRNLVLTKTQPAFRSEDYGDPAYAQLSRNAAEGILTGAEDGAEMGVFCHLKQPQRQANLSASLDEYLRFGLEAGVFFVT